MAGRPFGLRAVAPVKAPSGAPPAVVSAPAKPSVARRGWAAITSGGVSSAPAPRSTSLVPVGVPPAVPGDAPSSGSFGARGGGIAATIVGNAPGATSTSTSASAVNANGVGAWLRSGAFSNQPGALARATGKAPVTGDFFKRLASAITQPTASIATMESDVQRAPGFVPGATYAPSNVIPFPEPAPAPYYAPAYGGGGGGGGGGDSGGGSWGNAPAGGGGEGEDYSEQPGDDENYPGDENDSGGYSEYGGGDPADTFEHDRRAIAETSRFSPPDVDRSEDGGEGYASDSGVGFDNDADEDEGGQDYAQQSPPLAAPTGQEESWSYRDRRPMRIPGYMYTAPAYRPGGEEGDDSMDATGYLSALNDDGSAFSGAEDFFKSLGKDLAVNAAQRTLATANAALLGSGAKPVVVPPAPPMSLGKKFFIGVAVAAPVLYFLTRHRAPAIVSNGRRRWSYMPVVKNRRR